MSAAKPVVIVCHDAGGAEILSSYLLRQPDPGILVLEGPAVDIFRRKLGEIHPVPLVEAVSRAAWVLCGTSWQSDLEWQAIGLARGSGVRSVAFLDHWMNYSERFVREGTRHLPDEIWVGDEQAARIARAELLEVPVRIVDNPYLEDMRKAVAEISSRSDTDRERTVVLYVCEPMREQGLRHYGNASHFGYVEEEAVKYFLENLGFIAPNVDHVLLRLHPSEPRGKYSWVARSGVPVRVSEGTSLLEDIAAADVVVGCQSMAMVVALVAGKRVVSAIPPGGGPCALPQAEIELLSDLRARAQVS